MTILLRQKPLTQVVRQIVQRDNGAWFDPEDMSTMFLDAAGTTPVTALEQPVGLWLDKSQGLELGPELVTNGDFSNGTAMWTTVAGTTISGGKLIATNATYAVRQTISGLVVGKIYKITFTIDSISSGKVRCVFNGSTSPYLTQAGTYTVYHQSSLGDSILYLGFGGVPTSGVFDNVSVREIKGNHATQSITASRPTLSARYNLLLNSETLATQSVTTVAAQYTLSFTGTGSVTLSGTATGTLVGTGANNRVSLSFTPTAGTLTLTVTGSVTLAMLAFGTLTTYQAITTATDYDSVGWPTYIQSDGIDDYFNLPYLNLANSNAGVSAIFSADNIPHSASVSYILSEKTTSGTYPIYGLAYMNNAGNQKGFITDNAGVVKYDTGFYKPKYLAQVNSIIDTKSNIKNYLNGIQTLSVDYSASVVATNNNTIFAGNTGGIISDHIKMKLYGLIITKSALSDADRKRCEQFLASRLSTLGVTLS